MQTKESKEPQPSPEREALSPALRESMETAVHYEVAGTDGDFNDEDTARKAMLRFARVFAVRAKVEGYAEGRQAGAQEEREPFTAELERCRWIANHFERHGEIKRHKSFYECLCGATYHPREMPSVRATAQPPQEPQR